MLPSDDHYREAFSLTHDSHKRRGRWAGFWTAYFSGLFWITALVLLICVGVIVVRAVK